MGRIVISTLFLATGCYDLSGLTGPPGDLMGLFDLGNVDSTATNLTDLAGIDQGTSSCPAGMVAVNTTVGGGYCIDATEVNNNAYALFLGSANRGSPYMPACAGSDPTPGVWPVSGGGMLPVVNVDWCDSEQYCRWAGKRLCGKIGGGANAYADADVASKSQWFNACSNGGMRAYPYGDSYQPTICNSDDHGSVPTPTGSLAGCVGGVAGLFDMSANVWEWEDSCDNTSSPADQCRRRGGSFSDSTTACATPVGSFLVQREDWNDHLGFRCCKDL